MVILTGQVSSWIYCCWLLRFSGFIKNRVRQKRTCFPPSLTASSALRGVGETDTLLSLGSSGKPCIRRPPRVGFRAQFQGMPASTWQVWSVQAVGSCPGPSPRHAGPCCLRLGGLTVHWSPGAQFSRRLFTHSPVGAAGAGGCGLYLVSSLTSWARGRPSLPRPTRAPSTPSLGAFRWCPGVT